MSEPQDEAQKASDIAIKKLIQHVKECAEDGFFMTYIPPDGSERYTLEEAQAAASHMMENGFSATIIKWYWFDRHNMGKYRVMVTW